MAHVNVHAHAAQRRKSVCSEEDRPLLVTVPMENSAAVSNGVGANVIPPLGSGQPPLPGVPGSPSKWKMHKKCLKGRRSPSAAAAKVAKRGERGPTKIEVLAFYSRLAGLFLISLCILFVGFSAYPFVAPFHRRAWRRLVDSLQTLWVNSFLWLIPETNLIIQGDIPTASLKPKVVICNHQTDVDWFYMLMEMAITSYGRQDRTGSVKIFLKEEVRRIPVVGWGCSLFEFIFLKRKWDVDKVGIETSLERFCGDAAPLTIFLFPEGCTVNTRSMEKSLTWAREQNRPEFSLTLLPRSRGLKHICEVLARNSEDRDVEIYDQTMAFDSYSGEIPSWEQGYGRRTDILIPNFTSLMSGRASKRCYIDSRKFSYKEVQEQYADEISSSETDWLERFLDDRWLRKEHLLREFIDKHEFPGDSDSRLSVPITGSIWRSLMAVLFYIGMWAGVVFTYIKYKTSGDSFF